MFRDVARLTTARSLVSSVKRTQIIRYFASRKVSEADEDEIEAARKWLAKLDADTIRQNAICDISFSRSSGPGGQNVNKYVLYLSPS